MPNKPTTLREFVKVAIRPDQIEHLNESLSFDRKNNKPRALVRVIIEAELVDKSYLTSHNTELVSKIEGMKSESTSINQAVYNRAMDEVISIINIDISKRLH